MNTRKAAGRCRHGMWLIVMLMCWAPDIASAKDDSDRLVETAADVVAEISSIPEREIPPVLLRNCSGIAVIPNALKVGFMVGGRYGRGVVAVRDKDGTWKKPILVTLTGGSLGWQIGAEAADIVLVFKNRQSLDRIRDGKFTLGVDAAVAAGPVGRHAEAGTDLFLKSEIVSYSRSRGAFAGVAFEGAALQYDIRETHRLYGTNSYDKALKDPTSPASVSRFLQVLGRYTSQ